LVESELFGHEKGAFTGATSRRRGRFELANGGTLLLDEVGEMPLDVQVKLLRVIQEGEFERVGGSQTLSVDVRLIAATNRDLSEMVAQGMFREDLYYRLNVVVLRAPPLRERREDVPILIEHILNHRPTQRRVEITEEAIREIAGNQFPGNVRQLENIVDRLCIFYPGEKVTVEHVRQVTFDGVSQTVEGAQQALPMKVFQAGVSYRDRLLELERMLIEEALAEYGENKIAAAEALGTDKSFFYRKCRQFGLG
jgi:two-component system NtrC family response regulator